MKTRRNLSGVYFRVQIENEKFDSVCFEDMSEEEQDRQMDGRELEWHKKMIRIMSNTINELGDRFDLMSE